MSNILRLSEVIHRTGRSRSAIYRDIATGVFPKPIALGVRAIGWHESDIAEWIASRPAANIRSPDISSRSSGGGATR